MPTSTDLTREGIPLSTTPTRVVEPAGGSSAAIGKSVVVKGQIYSREDLYVDGEVEGTIEVQEHRLTVGPNGKVQASIKAREVVIRGTVHGNISAGEKIDIRKDAKLVGDLKTGRIVIEDGAYFKGSIDIVRPEVTRTPAAARPKTPPATAPHKPAAPSASAAGAGDAKR
jgi:cytoskeletal protein CcmA (bactofilin family)